MCDGGVNLAGPLPLIRGEKLKITRCGGFVLGTETLCGDGGEAGQR